MNDFLDILKSLNAMDKIVLSKERSKEWNEREETKMYLQGYRDSLQYAMTLVSNKIYEAEEKQNA